MQPLVTTTSPATGGTEIPEATAPPDSPIPRPLYPSDTFRTAADRGGPAPLLTSAIDRHGFPSAWAMGYTGQDVRLAIVDQGVDFGHPDLNTSYAVDPNAGWPIAFDPKSMGAYLRTGLADNTWYANTTRTGAGPFEVTHTIHVDGTSDFGETEKIGTDPRDNTILSPGGIKRDYDLTDLYLTRDGDRWFFGFSSYLVQDNNTYVLLLDTDNETTGTTTVPGGKLADTNTSAADIVTDVAFRPDGLRIATVSADRYLRVWDRSGAVVFAALAHTAKPTSVAWSPNGNLLATADPNFLVIWDTSSWTIRSQVNYVPFTDTPLDENGILGWAPNSTWIAAGTNRYVHIINALTGVRFGTLWATTASQVNAVRFNNLGTQIAAALGDSTIPVFNVNATNIQPYPPASRAFAALTLSGGHSAGVLDIAWSPTDPNRMISGGRDNAAVLWNVGTQMAIASSTVSGGYVTGVEWRKDGNGFVTVSAGLLPITAPRLIYWSAAGAPGTIVDQRAPMSGIDTSTLPEVATSSHDLSARLWTLAGAPTRVLVAHRSDAAIVVDGWSRYSDRDEAFIHGLDVATFYRWNTTTSRWEGTGLFDPAVNGTQASFQFGERLFNEISLPRDLLGDPPGLSLILFTAGRSATKPQDTVPSDTNANFRNLDFGPGALSLGAFVHRRPGSYAIDPSIISRSGTFHFGYHPSPVLTQQFGPIGLLVADTVSPDAYDAVYMDLDNDRRFEPSDARLARSSPVGALDYLDATTGLPGMDGIADISAGLLYFIADGTRPIPYSERYLQLLADPALANRIPGNGDLLAFVGEFGLDPVTGAKSDHGTRIASLVVGKGVLTAPSQGVAPASKLIALGNAMDDITASWYFAVEGYDGTPGTGDEAQVVLSPFILPTSANDGFDSYSRTADFLSYIHSGGSSLFVAPAGDTGFGYGSIVAPASAPGVLAVARAEDGTYRSSTEGGPEGPNPHYLDVAVTSARGPTAIGTPKPDLVAVGSAVTDLPLHSAPGDGTTAVAATPMTGTDVSAAVAAGAAAVVWRAFVDGHGRAPTAEELTHALRSGAIDVGYDALVQGSGFLDVAESVRIARGWGGILVSPGTLVPGDFRGSRAAAFAHLMTPGESDTVSLQVENRGSAPTTVDVSATVYTLLGRYAVSDATIQSPYSPTGDITFWLNASGVSKVDGTTFAVVPLAAPIPGAWVGADLVKITAFSDIERFVWKPGTAHQINYSYTLRAMDWEVNDTNWIGLPYGPFPAPALFSNELNTASEAAHQANVLEVRVREPATSLRDGLVVNLGETSSGTGLTNLNWTFVVELYGRVAWGWTAITPTSTPLSGGQTASLAVSVSVPAGAGLGIYEGLVLVTNRSSGRTTGVPIVVNVAGSGPDFRVGGNLLSTELYDNSRLFGGNDFALRNDRIARPYMGDWRFYYLDVPTAGTFENPRGVRLLIDLRWGVKPSDLDIQLFGRTAADAFSTNHADRYGPSPLLVRGKTEELDKPDFNTATNESEDVLTVDLLAGLNVVAIHATRLKGGAPDEPMVGAGGWVRVRPNVDVATPLLAAEASFSFVSSLNLTTGLRASAVGPATTSSLADVEIPQDWQSWWNFPNWGEFLWRGSFTYEFNLQKALILEVHIVGAGDVGDLDLGVFRDMNDDGQLTLDEARDANSRKRGGNDWDWDADGDADETVKWIAPPDGRYFVKVLGFTVNAIMGHFDMDISITLDTGKGYEIPQAPKPAEIVAGTQGGVAPFTPVDFTMAWDFPGDTADGDYGGAVLLGLPNAPGVLVVPVSVGLDRVAPTIANFTLSTIGGRLDEADGRTTTDPSPTLLWSLADPARGELDPTRVTVLADGVDVSSDAKVTIDLTPNPFLVQGYWTGTVQYVPRELAEGLHALELQVGDLAGNLATHEVTVILDTTAPPLVVEGPPVRFTRASLETIAVTSQPGAYVSFGGAWVRVDASGRLTTTIALAEGRNDIRVAAADWFDSDIDGNPVPGNSQRAVVTIIRDNTSPRFSRAPSSDEVITASEGAVVRGTVVDEIAAGIAWAAEDVRVTVAGTPVDVRADGGFVAVVPLIEGANTIPVVATDLAGNAATAWANVTRDTQAPALSVDELPAQVTEGQVVVTGTAEAGSIVTVNGFVAPLSGGRFLRNLTLSGGDNAIVVRAEDAAGNAAEVRLSVSFVSPPSDLTGAYAMIAGGAAAVFLVVFLLARRFLFPPARAEAASEGHVEEPRTEGEAPTHEDTEKEESSAPATEPEDEFATIEEAGSSPIAEVPAAEPEDPRAARLRGAFEAGKISREVYEANLRKLGKTP